MVAATGDNTRARAGGLANMPIRKKGLLLVGILCLVELILVGGLTWLLMNAEAAAMREVRSRDTSARTSELFQLMFDASYVAVRYIKGQGTQFRQRLESELPQADSQMEHLEELVKDNPEYRTSLANCKRLIEDQKASIRKMCAAYDKSGGGMAWMIYSSPERREKELAAINALYGFVQQQEPNIKEDVQARLRAQHAVKNWLVAGVVLNICLAVGLFLLFVSSIVRGIDILVDNSKRLADGKKLNAVQSQSDEIGKLDQVFHHMAQVLEETAKKERALIENTCDVICSLDTDGKFLSVSPAASIVWGIGPDELKGQPISKLVIEEDVPNILERISQLKSSTADVDASIETRIRRRDGRILDMLWSAHWSNLDQCLFCVVHDISERKLAAQRLAASEARIKTILDHTLAGLITLKNDGMIELANPRAMNLLHYEQTEIEGRSLAELFPQSKAQDPAAFLETLRTKALGKPIEMIASTKGGQPLPVEITISEFQAVDGPRSLVNLIDVTERHAVEQMKKEFVAMVSHDLRTPLNSVGGFLELLTEGVYGEMPARGMSGAELASRNVGRILRLVNDLLEITKFESEGKIELACSDADLGGILERSAEAVRVFAEKHSVRLECPSIKLNVWADPDRMERVVVNLVSNAVKFSPANEAVSIEVEDKPESVLVKVIDRGRGVPAEYRHVIFERFKQVKKTDATQKGGTGLGLAICKAIVEEHGGTIGVDSEEGKGSVFWFSLPKKKG